MRLQEQRLRFLGHCSRSNQPVSKLLSWDHCLEFNCSNNRGNIVNFTKNLMEWEILVEIQNCMLSRVEWGRKIKEITKNN
jgi:hypothetical protein